MRARPKLPEHYHKVRGGFCRWCGLAILNPDGSVNRRRTWHKSACLDAYFIVSDPNYASRRAFERDQGMCRACNLDIDALDRTRNDLWRSMHRARTQEETVDAFGQEIEAAKAAWEKLRHHMLGLGFKERHVYPRIALYENDHVLPVWQSAGEIGFFTLENMQTLCSPCHHKKTVQDMRDRRVWLRTHPHLRVKKALPAKA